MSLLSLITAPPAEPAAAAFSASIVSVTTSDGSEFSISGFVSGTVDGFSVTASSSGHYNQIYDGCYWYVNKYHFNPNKLSSIRKTETQTGRNLVLYGKSIKTHNIDTYNTQSQ